uniref:Transglutaminase N-terminal domain-containing protein n=1 Tax=Neolamprologus brichardi TaxID=32507 RepID=A0A3Q4HEU4_NEOBR
MGSVLIAKWNLILFFLPGVRFDLKVIHILSRSRFGNILYPCDQLIVRRGQPFTVKVELTQPVNPDLYPLTITAETGWSVIIQ